MRRRILLLMTLLLAVFAAQAATVEHKGVCYSTVGSNQGTRQFPAYNVKVVAGSAKYTGDIAIPAVFTNGNTIYKVIAIDDEAFKGCTGLTSVDMSAATHLTSIGENAFRECAKLASVTFSDKLTSIGAYAFFGCSALTEVEIPEGIETVSKYMFNACSSLKKVTLPSTVTKVCTHAFASCSSLADIEIKATTPPACEIEVFVGVNYEKINLHIPAGSTADYQKADTWKGLAIKAPGAYTYAFENEDGVMIYYSLIKNDYVNKINQIHVTNPYTNTNDMGSAYKGTVRIPATFTNSGITFQVTGIDDEAFRGCKDLVRVVVPKSVTTIGKSAFASSGIVGATLLCTNVTLGDEAFAYCSNLESIALPEGITTLPNMAFFTCYNMKRVELPESLTSLGVWSFANCSGLEEIVMNSVTPPTYNNAGIAEKIQQNVLLITPKGQHEAYKAAEGWSDFKNIVSPAYDSKITYGTTYYLKMLEWRSHSSTYELTHQWNAVKGTDEKFLTGDYTGTVTIPAPFTLGTRTVHITGIDDYAFAGQTGLTEVVVEEGVTRIGEGAFGASGVQKVTLPTGIEQISKLAFAQCRQLQSIELPEGVESIREYAFFQCPSLKTAKMPQSLRYIDKAAFFNCESLESVEMPKENMLGIGENAFSLCSSLKSFVVPEGVEEIAGILIGAKSLRTLTLPSTLKRVNSYVVNGADNMESITINAATPPECAADAFLGGFLDAEHVYSGIDTDKVTLYVPDGAEKAYKEADVWKDFKNITSSALDLANAFRSIYADVLAKSVETVASSDLTDIESALITYATLTEVVKTELASEKALLDALKTKAEELKKAEDDAAAEAAALAAEIKKFRDDNADILAKTVETVESSNLEAIESALTAYAALSAKAQETLTTEKTLLDNLKTKAEELKKAEEAANGIATPTANNASGNVIYNMNGARVRESNMRRGVYVVNGKKVLVK